MSWFPEAIFFAEAGHETLRRGMYGTDSAKATEKLINLGRANGYADSTIIKPTYHRVSNIHE
jgi:hypothetical protein